MTGVSEDPRVPGSDPLPDESSCPFTREEKRGCGGDGREDCDVDPGGEGDTR